MWSFIHILKLKELAAHTAREMRRWLPTRLQKGAQSSQKERYSHRYIAHYFHSSRTKSRLVKGGLWPTKYRIKGPGTLSILETGAHLPLVRRQCRDSFRFWTPRHRIGLFLSSSYFPSPLLLRTTAPRRTLVTNFISRESRQAYPIAAYWI